jgi:hypothetical protein
MATTHHQSAEHEFKGTWRWPKAFETWVEDLIADADGPVANVFAGLSTLGDVRVDLKTPTELVVNLQKDSGTTLERARTYLQDHISGTPHIDVVSSLYAADSPTSHPAADYIETDKQTIKSDIFHNRLPFPDNEFSWVLADPPWKEVPKEAREHVISELMRVTSPGGHILHNGFWIPTGDYPATLDSLVPRQDTSRWTVGTPKVSWVGIYTVHDSIETAHHLSRTLPSREYEPEPSTLEAAIRAETHFELQHKGGFNADDYDLDIVDPTSPERCPNCGCRRLSPVGENVVPSTEGEELYQCERCYFRPFRHEVNMPTATSH